MSRNKKTKTISIFIVVLIILAIAIIALLVYNIVTSGKYNEDDKIVHDVVTGEIISGELLELYNMEEAERIKHYFTLYIDAIESKEFETAYNMLDTKFKDNYFKTLDSFTQYINSKYSPIISVTYDDIIRMGNYYVIDVTFLDLFSSTADKMVGESQKFVIYETDYNKYTMSFQAE